MMPRLTFGLSVSGAFPRTNLANVRNVVSAQLANAGEFIRETWETVARQRQIRDTGAYLRGITSDARITIALDARGMEVTGTLEVTNTAPHARFVEEGHGAFHLPSRINWAGGKVKVSAAGVRYLSIPFSHSAYASPGRATSQGLTNRTRASMLPRTVYNRARKLAVTTKLLQGPQHDAHGRYIAADRYTAGGRLADNGRIRTDQTSKGTEVINPLRGAHSVIGAGENAEWSASKYDGLMRAPLLGGARTGSRYYTIRTLTQNSPNWNIPAVPGKHVARDVTTFLRSTAGQAILKRRMTSAMKDEILRGEP